MSMNEFLNHCTACGGNWVAMLLTGIKSVFPEHYETVTKTVEGIGFGHGGVPAFAYVCEWLSDHGIVVGED